MQRLPSQHTTISSLWEHKITLEHSDCHQAICTLLGTIRWQNIHNTCSPPSTKKKIKALPKCSRSGVRQPMTVYTGVVDLPRCVTLRAQWPTLDPMTHTMTQWPTLDPMIHTWPNDPQMIQRPCSCVVTSHRGCETSPVADRTLSGLLQAEAWSLFSWKSLFKTPEPPCKMAWLPYQRRFMVINISPSS